MTVDKVIANIIWLTFLAHPVHYLCVQWAVDSAPMGIAAVVDRAGLSQ